MPLPLSYYKRIQQGENPANFVTAGCLRPKKLHVYDSLTSTYRPMFVDCGHCLNCERDARSQWVSRMCLHSLDWKHCYFVTLTYGSYNLHLYENHPFKSDWLETYPVEDSFNTFHAPRWTPSILHKGHLAKFFKRLRENTGATISYAACGEYGEDFGRPHFHCVVWSQSVLSLEDFKHAWSYKCVKHSPTDIRRYTGKEKEFFYFRIGRVQMYDLVANGTLDWKAEYSGSPNSAAHCFQYVAKYLRKNNVNNAYTTHRLKEVYIAQPLDANQFDASPEGVREAVAYDRAFINPDLPNYLDEKNSFVYRNFNYNKNHYEKLSFSEFCKILAPFFVCSRGYAIGKEYALANLARFEASNYSLPKFQGRQLAFPAYFAKLAANQKNPVRLSKTNWNGSTLIKGSFESIYAFYSALRESRDAFYTLPRSIRSAVSSCFPDYLGNTDYLKRSCITDTDRHGSMLNIVLLDPVLGSIKYVYNPNDDIFEGYVYNKHTRMYELVEFTERIDFCDFVLDCFDRQFADKPAIMEKRQLQLDLYDTLASVPNRCDKIDRYTAHHDYTQSRYKTEHFNRKDNQ